MTRHLHVLRLTSLLLAALPGCISDPPRRPPALDPSNPVAPESIATNDLRQAPTAPTTSEPLPTNTTSTEPAPPSAAGNAPNEKPRPTGYTCPMHPEIQQSSPGRCPKCGMELVPRTMEGAHQHGAMP
jgi:hypothetical protein